jgi:hypothetical protein
MLQNDIPGQEDPIKRFALELRWMLRALLYEEVSCKESKKLSFRVAMGPREDPKEPSSSTQRKALDRLEEMQAIRIPRRSCKILGDTTYFMFDIEILQPKFSQVYAEYEKTNELPLEQKMTDIKPQVDKIETQEMLGSFFRGRRGKVIRMLLRQPEIWRNHERCKEGKPCSREELQREAGCTELCFRDMLNGMRHRLKHIRNPKVEIVNVSTNQYKLVIKWES